MIIDRIEFPRWQIYYGSSYGWWTIGEALPVQGIFLTYHFMSDEGYCWREWEKAVREGTPQRVMGWLKEPLLYIENGESFYLRQKQDQEIVKTRKDREYSKNFKRPRAR